MIWICKTKAIASIDKDALLHPLTDIFPVKGCKSCFYNVVTSKFNRHKPNGQMTREPPQIQDDS